MSHTLARSIFSFILAFSFVFLIVTPVFAQQGGGGTGGPQGGGSTGTLNNPLTGVNSVADFIQKLLKAIVLIAVPISILFIVLAGFRFIAAQGSPEELKKARANFLHVVIGIAIFIGAWELANLILNTMRAAGVQV